MNILNKISRKKFNKNFDQLDPKCKTFIKYLESVNGTPFKEFSDLEDGEVIYFPLITWYDNKEGVYHTDMERLGEDDILIAANGERYRFFENEGVFKAIEPMEDLNSKRELSLEEYEELKDFVEISNE